MEGYKRATDPAQQMKALELAGTLLGSQASAASEIIDEIGKLSSHDPRRLVAESGPMHGMTFRRQSSTESTALGKRPRLYSKSARPAYSPTTRHKRRRSVITRPFQSWRPGGRRPSGRTTRQPLRRSGSQLSSSSLTCRTPRSTAQAEFLTKP